MEKVRYSDVFKPNTYPDITYVTRISAHANYTYEERLEQSLETEGVLISIIGPSKSGKTVLCDKVNDVAEDSCRFTCVNFPYESVVKLLKAGPFTRGQKRLKYKLADGLKLDLYSIVLKILAENPPCTEMEFKEIFQRIIKKVTDTENKVTAKKIQATLKNLQKLINEQRALYQVFEWKDNCLYILDPLFLFYIRWVDFWR